MGDKSLTVRCAKRKSRCKLKALLWEPRRAASSRSGWGVGSRVKGMTSFRVGGVLRILKDEQELCRCTVSHSVMSDTLQPHGLRLTRLFCPWDFPGKNTSVSCRFLLQGIFLTQGSNLDLLHCSRILYRCTTWEAHVYQCSFLNNRSIFLCNCDAIFIAEF